MRKEICVNILSLLALVLVFGFNAQAKTTKDIFFGKATENVEVPFGEKTTLVFSHRVKSHSDSKNYKISLDDNLDPDYRVFSITPLFTTGEDRVSFKLENGKTARLKFSTIKNEDKGFMEWTYSIQAKAYQDVSNAPPIGEVELLKAMIRDDSVAGYKRSKRNQKVASGRKGVKSTLVRVYRGRNLSGYVFKLQNTLTRNNVKIDVKSLKIGDPNLAILSQSDSMVLYPRKSKKGPSESFVRIVAKPSSQFKAMRLPMTTEKTKKKGE